MWYNNNTGTSFETEEEAREAAFEDQDFEDFSGYFSCYVNYDKLLKWAMEQENFFSSFDDEYSMANEDYFNNNYYEEEDE